VSATTRAMRPGEVDGEDYHFLTRERFQALIEQGEFLEWADYNGNLYGTLRAPVAAAIAGGRVFVLEIEVQGTRQLRESGVEALFVFVVPPDMDTLRARLEARGANSPEEIEQRLAIAREELGAKDLYDHIVPNEDLDETIASVRQLIGAP